MSCPLASSTRVDIRGYVALTPCVGRKSLAIPLAIRGGDGGDISRSLVATTIDIINSAVVQPIIIIGQQRAFSIGIVEDDNSYQQ